MLSGVLGRGSDVSAKRSLLFMNDTRAGTSGGFSILVELVVHISVVEVSLEGLTLLVATDAAEVADLATTELALEPVGS